MRWLLALALLATSSLAHAQERMAPDLCELALQNILDLTDFDATDATTGVDEQGWCVTTGLTIPAESLSVWRIGTLRWRATGIRRLIDEGLPPTGFELSASDLSMIYDTGDPVMDYSLGIQFSGLDIAFEAAVRWDALQKVVFVDRLGLSFAEGNSVTLSGQIDRIDMSNAAALETSLGSAGVSALRADIRFDGWFEAYVLMVLAQVLLDEGPPTPAEQVAVLKQQGIAFLGLLPAPLLPDQSEAALASFIQTLPQPKGRLRLDLTSAQPIGMSRIAPLLLTGAVPTPLEAVEAIFDGATLIVNWEPQS